MTTPPPLDSKTLLVHSGLLTIQIGNESAYQDGVPLIPFANDVVLLNYEAA
jgi:hypothetical protein